MSVNYDQLSNAQPFSIISVHLAILELGDLNSWPSALRQGRHVQQSLWTETQAKGNRAQKISINITTNAEHNTGCQTKSEE